MLQAQLAGNSAIENLQAALMAYAQAAGKPAANPGAATGQVSDQTLAALQVVFPLIAGKLGTIGTLLKQALPYVLSNPSLRATAISIIGSNAGTIANVVRGLLSATSGAGAAATDAAPVNTGATSSAHDILDRLRPAMGAQTLSPTRQTVWPAGSIRARSGDKWRLAVPRGTQATTQQLYGAALGDVATHEELLPVPVATAVVVTLPATEVTEKELEEKVGKPWYKKWYWWAAIGGGVAAVGVGVWALTRSSTPLAGNTARRRGTRPLSGTFRVEVDSPISRGHTEEDWEDYCNEVGGGLPPTIVSAGDADDSTETWIVTARTRREAISRARRAASRLGVNVIDEE